MTLENYINEIKLKLTGDVLDLEIEDSTIIKVINSAIREILPYYDEVNFVTVPFKSCINFSEITDSNGKEIRPSSVLNVFRCDALAAATGEAASLTDPMGYMAYQLLGGLSNFLYMQDYTYNYLAYNTALLMRNTVSTDLSNFYNKNLNCLYINSATSTPNNITIAYIPLIDDVNEIKSDYWINTCINLSVAIAKRIIGTIRTKYKLSNALWTINGDLILGEGINEYNEIITYLKDNHDICDGID